MLKTWVSVSGSTRTGSTDAGQQTRGRKGSEQKDLRKEDSKHLPRKIPEGHEWGQRKGKGQSLKGSRAPECLQDYLSTIWWGAWMC